MKVQPTEKLHNRQHLNIAILWFGMNFMWGALLGPILAEQIQQLDPSAAAHALGLLYGVTAFAPLLLPLLFGPISDRCTSRFGRRRPFIAVGGGITVLGLLFMVGALSAGRLIGYFVGYFIVQCGANVALGAYMGVIPDQVPELERGKASSYMAVMSNLGTLLGAATPLVLGVGSKAELLIIVVLGTAFIYTCFTLNDAPITDPKDPLKILEHIKGLWIDPRKYPDFAWVWATRFLMMVGFYMIQPYMNFYVRDFLGVANPAKTTAIVLAIILVVATVSGYLAGVRSDTVGRKRIVILASAIITLAAVLFCFAKTLPVGIFFGAIFGLGYGAYVSVDWALGTDVLPNQEEAAKSMSVWHIAMVLPQQIAPVIAGTFILSNFKAGYVIENHDRVMSYSPHGYQIMFGLAAVFFALSGILIRNVRNAR